MAGILLVEDDPSVRAGLELALTRQGHSVTAYATGEEALDHVRSRHPEIAILDVMLPGIDGVEVCRRIRRLGPLPIILLTARGDDLDVVVGLEAARTTTSSNRSSRGSWTPASAPSCAASSRPRPTASPSAIS
ncbi:hypothetical protein GCM10027612_81810 [Microbispora bryophytorum subsp. camponoti]